MTMNINLRIKINLLDRGNANKPDIILKNNNLHFEIIINRAFSAAHDIAGISDVIASQLSQLYVIMRIVLPQ